MKTKKKFLRLLNLLLALALLSGCSLPFAASPKSTPTSLPAPEVRVTSAPAADGAALMQAYLTAWQNDDYPSMYAMLTPASQQAISADDFAARYRNTMNALTLKQLSYEILSQTTDPAAAQVNFRVTYTTNLFGELQREMSARLEKHASAWTLNWNESLVLPELSGGNSLTIDYQTPARGIILDRTGQPLVTQTDAYALGLVPTNIVAEQEDTLVGELSRLLNISPSQAIALYNDRRDVYWYLPIGEATAEAVNQRWNLLSSLGGLVLTPYTSRFYYQNGIAPQTVGYVSPIPKEEEDLYARAGYSRDARVGRAGLEQWAEQYLAGRAGGTLYLSKTDGTLTQQASTASQPAANLQLTLDKTLQIQAQEAIAGFRGSIVVIERDTGRVLAMVSSPQYDPNLFEPQNQNSADGIGELFNNPNQPLVNRATQGQYPLGSVFKVITYVAALESGTYTPDLKLQCGYDWTELPDKVRHDWTWEHFQQELAATGEGKTRPSGELTLSEGLMRSCNPWFWHIGLDLYRQGRVNAIADMARAFGLGQPTGLAQIPEGTGQILNPAGEVEAVNQAIGQGDVLVTPLQVADFMAAIGNGGTLYRPQLVEKIIAADGTETTLFKPEARGTLPIKPENLEALRKAMWEVVHNPRGTAVHRFRNINVPIYGKTGTAESGSGLPHAWFAGYTDAQIEGFPDIAIAVIVENEGEGSDYGAPIFKRVVEDYFFGSPRSLYWWEANIGITRTPTPLGFEGTLTAQPQP
jgi:penicillin-binding protein 2